jgi:hypothetical protein
MSGVEQRRQEMSGERARLKATEIATATLIKRGLRVVKFDEI